MSEPKQEWTGAGILADFQKVNGIDVHALAKAINTAIAAEREKNKQADIELDRLDRERSQVRQQLLAAQAAIAEHNKECERFNAPMWRIKADLSALAAEREINWALGFRRLFR